MPTTELTKHPAIGIITASVEEHTAVDALLENAREYVAPGGGAGRRYQIGEIPTKDGGRHFVALSLAGMGNNIAALRASRLLDHFPSMNSIIMVGIAGGVPHPKKVDDHVRLGDVVVSNEGGVVQYDMDKEKIEITIHRHPPRPPSALLLEGVNLLKATERSKKSRPWIKYIKETCKLLGVKRPAEKTDILVDSANPEVIITHPKDPKRRRGQPRIFAGPIASANKLLKNPQKRDSLRDKFSVKAVEMEGSGIADATWNHDKGYLVVRGICDYCDSKNNDIWQEYAAIAAAAYTRALLESIPPEPSLSTLIDQLDQWEKEHQSLQKGFDDIIRPYRSNT